MKNKGFTLIELLIVISIIAVLSAIGLIVYRSIQIKARDGIRKRDLNNLATALEIYAQQHNGSYIYRTGSTGTCDTDTPIFYDQTNGIASYISDGVVPMDPKSTSASEIPYCYISSNGSTYTLCAFLENASDSDKNALCPTDYNYGVVPK